jgi:hypothetical protein
MLIVGIAQSKEGSSMADDWDERPHTIEEVKAMLQQRKESAMKREKVKTLSHNFSQQVLFHLLLCFTLHFNASSVFFLLHISVS